MTALKTSLLCIELLRRVSKNANEDFAGIGFICYDNLSNLPHLPLNVPKESMRALPIFGMEAIETFFVQASLVSSPLHDGFHLISLQHFVLTHMCQFIAPVIASIPVGLHLDSGARHMTAQLASRAQGIETAALISKGGTGVVYEDGARVFEERLR